MITAVLLVLLATGNAECLACHDGTIAPDVYIGRTHPGACVECHPPDPDTGHRASVWRCQECHNK